MLLYTMHTLAIVIHTGATLVMSHTIILCIPWAVIAYIHYLMTSSVHHYNIAIPTILFHPLYHARHMYLKYYYI